MNITLAELQDERQRLTKDFNELKDKIQKVEIDVGTMKSNLNALYGAIQQTDRLISKIKGDKGDKNPMSAEKEKALNLATS